VAQQVIGRLGVPEQRIVVTRLGVDRAWSSAVAPTEVLRATLGLPPRYLLFVGAAQPRKGLDVLLEAHRSRPELAPLVLVLSVVGILYGALLAVGQSDLKRFVAYTSVAHFGFIALGTYALTIVVHTQRAVGDISAPSVATIVHSAETSTPDFRPTNTPDRRGIVAPLPTAPSTPTPLPPQFNRKDPFTVMLLGVEDQRRLHLGSIGERGGSCLLAGHRAHAHLGLDDSAHGDHAEGEEEEQGDHQREFHQRLSPLVLPERKCGMSRVPSHLDQHGTAPD